MHIGNVTHHKKGGGSGYKLVCEIDLEEGIYQYSIGKGGKGGYKTEKKVFGITYTDYIHPEDGGSSYLKKGGNNIVSITGGGKGGNDLTSGGNTGIVSFGNNINYERDQINSKAEAGVCSGDVTSAIWGGYQCTPRGGNLNAFNSTNFGEINPGKGGNELESGTGGYIKIEFLHQ